MSTVDVKLEIMSAIQWGDTKGLPDLLARFETSIRNEYQTSPLPNHLCALKGILRAIQTYDEIADPQERSEEMCKILLETAKAVTQ